MKDITSICDQIRYYHRERNYAMGQRKSLDLKMGAHLRMVLGWSLAIPKAEQEAIRKKAADIFKTAEAFAKQEAKPEGKRKPVDGLDDPDFIRSKESMMATIQGRKAFDLIEADTTKQMERLAEQLPVWEAFGINVRGFGPRSLAVIVGESGNLSNYPKKGHLWKRMGVAVIDGVRQGGLSKGAKADDWIEHGYNAERRSKMFVIGDTMIKTGDYYRQVYLDRKEYERDQAEGQGLIVAPSAKIPEKRKAEFISDGHIHRRSQRYMEKRLLRDLWQAWNHCEAIVVLPEMAIQKVPSSDQIKQLEAV